MTVTNISANTRRIDSNDVVATIQVLRRAGIIDEDVLPDALLAVLRAKLLPWEAGDAAMAALGLNKGIMAEARARADRAEAMFEYGSDTKRAAEPRPQGDRIPNVRTPTYQRKAPAYRQPTRQRPVSDDGDLCCSVCGKWKPAEEFMLRTDRIGSGTRRSACTPCHNERNKSRYLNVTAVAALNAVGLTFTVSEGDDAASLSCVLCGARLEVGDDVTTAENVGVMHMPGGCS